MRTLAAAVFLTLAAAACSGSSSADLPRPSREFCEAANRYEKLLEQAPPPSVADQIELVEVMATNAPKGVRRDANTFLDALRRVEDDPSIRGDPEIATAVKNVNRRATNGCDFYKQSPRSGL